MVQINRWTETGTVILVLFIILNSLTFCFFNLGLAESVDEGLDTLFLSKYYLVPERPGDDPSNYSTLSAENTISFGHNIRDRKLDRSIIPELNLWLDDGGNAGIELEFEIRVQAVKDNTVVPDKSFWMLFKNYTTIGKSGPQPVNIGFINYAEETFDIDKGMDNWAIFTLTIQRTDNLTGSDLRIYHGADGKASYLKLPWNQTLSKFEYENEKNDDNDVPGFELALFAFAFIVIIAFVQILKSHYKN
jgi:hypothetical protein